MINFQYLLNVDLDNSRIFIKYTLSPIINKDKERKKNLRFLLMLIGLKVFGKNILS